MDCMVKMSISESTVCRVHWLDITRLCTDYDYLNGVNPAV